MPEIFQYDPSKIPSLINIIKKSFPSDSTDHLLSMYHSTLLSNINELTGFDLRHEDIESVTIVKYEANISRGTGRRQAEIIVGVYTCKSSDYTKYVGKTIYDGDPIIEFNFGGIYFKLIKLISVYPGSHLNITPNMAVYAIKQKSSSALKNKVIIY